MSEQVSEPVGTPSPLETRIGVGILVLRDGRLLLGERLGSHGAGTWAPPGGHLEDGEDISTCARRELREETGLELGDWREGSWSVDDFPDIGRRYVTLFVIATGVEGEPQRCEPGKCARWDWFAWTDLPSPLFRPLESLVASWQPPAA